jgi:octaprenyl-diphosphate synthase
MALAARTVGKTNDATITAATIVEMVHLATLVHDDIMDDAVLRRGQPTVAANWGNEISVLLGDCLFAQALQLAASFPTPEVCGMVAAATKTVCSGEILQTRNGYRLDLTQEEYFRILNMKTGELFGLSCDLGGGLAGATPQQRKFLRQFGLDLGTAYQVYDDCLDLFGTETMAGKSLGTDLLNGILTLPSLLLLGMASPADQDHVRNLLASFERASLPEVLRLLDKYDALSQCQRIVDELCAQARQRLGGFPCASGQEILGQVAHFLAQQTRQLGVVQ